MPALICVTCANFLLHFFLPGATRTSSESSWPPTCTTPASAGAPNRLWIGFRCEDSSTITSDLLLYHRTKGTRRIAARRTNFRLTVLLADTSTISPVCCLTTSKLMQPLCIWRTWPCSGLRVFSEGDAKPSSNCTKDKRPSTLQVSCVIDDRNGPWPMARSTCLKWSILSFLRI